jgi:hypothetical protein
MGKERLLPGEHRGTGKLGHGNEVNKEGHSLSEEYRAGDKSEQEKEPNKQDTHHLEM